MPDANANTESAEVESKRVDEAIERKLLRSILAALWGQKNTLTRSSSTKLPDVVTLPDIRVSV